MVRSFIFFLCLAHAFVVGVDHWTGDAYHQHSSPQHRWAFSLIKKVSFNGSERILDVGCGDGKITAQMAKELPSSSFLGIDISPSMIAFATEHFSSDNLSFSLQDATSLPYQDEFDILFSFTALHWIQNQADFLQGAHQALKETGILAITMPLSLSETLEIALSEVSSSPEWSSYFHDFSPEWIFVRENSYERQEEEYLQLLRDYHFVPTHYTVFVSHDTLPSREHLEQFVAQWLPHLRRLPEHLKGPFLAPVIDRYLELEGISPEGEVPFYLRRIEVIAKKAAVE